MPLVLDRKYHSTLEALQRLSNLSMLKVVHSFLTDLLAGAGHRRLRAVIHVGVAVFNVLIDLWPIPAYPWRGAAWPSIASVLFLSRRLRTETPQMHAMEVSAEI